jgi:hypothetical protein
MNRRSFLKLATVSSAVGLAAASSHTHIALGKDMTVPAPDLDAQPSALLHLQNDNLDATIFSDATALIKDVRNQLDWHMGPVAFQDETPIDIGHVWVRTGRSPCEQYPGRFRGRREGDGIRFWVVDPLGKARGSFHVRAALDGPWIEFRLTGIDESLPSLCFPPPIECESLVIPQGVGRWIRKPLEERSFCPFFSRLNMRWFGGLREQHGWIAIFPEQNFADSGVMMAKLSAFPTWLKSMNRWSEPRAVRYTFLKGDYTDLAKCYRKWAMDKGLHRSLTEKADSTPALRNLLEGRLVSICVADAGHDRAYDENTLRPVSADTRLGTKPDLHFRYEDVEHILMELPANNVPQALVIIRGWIRGGYDYSHPDIWPPEASVGSFQQLQHLCSVKDAFRVGLHDNYQDIYAHCPSFPHGVDRLATGELLAGGYWGGGQAYILNSRDGVRYAERNWQQLQTLSPSAMFIDTTSAVQSYQSFEPGNTLTRSQDIEFKSKLLQFFKRQGVVLGSEEGADFAVPFLDWNENRHERAAGESVPLWPLVFHDAVACGRYVSDDAGTLGWLGGLEGKTSYPQRLLDMLWGYFILSGLGSAGTWEKERKGLNGSAEADRWFRSISMAAMEEHHFLSEDGNLEQTVFSNGRSILVNFGDTDVQNGKSTIPPHSYLID